MRPSSVRQILCGGLRASHAEGAAPSDIYSDAQLEKICLALSEKLEKAARNGVETIN
jgi:hypothetical protein